MPNGESFMNWLNKHNPELFEIFNNDGIFLERKNDHFILHITIIDEEISLVDLNKLQIEWNNFIHLVESEEKAYPLIVSQNKF
jgi:hypothetical protein